MFSIFRRTKRERGFSLFEVLVVMAFMAVIGSVGLGYYFNYHRQTILKTTAEEVAAYLYEIQQKSVGQEDASQWGVRFSNPAGDKSFYASFKGAIYTSPMEIKYLDGPVDFLYPADGTNADIVFNKINGKTSDGEFKKVYIQLAGGGTTKAVKVSPAGVISVDDGEVGWWKFDEGSGTTAGDSSGYGNTGTIYGAGWLNGASCKNGSCLSLDGVNDYIGMGKVLNATFSGTNSWTVSQWVSYSPGYSYYPQFCKGLYSSGPGPGFTIHGANGRIEGGNGTVGYDVPAGIFQESLSGQGWRHTVVIYDGTIFKAYVNSQTRGTFNWTNGIGNTSNYDLWLGRFWGPYGAMLMDDVRIYDRALSSDEVKHLYETTK